MCVWSMTVMVDSHSSEGRLRSWIAKCMRYVLLRPTLKKPIMQLLAIVPGLSLSLKRFGVRAGLAQSMGPGHLTIHRRHQDLVRQGKLSVREAQIYRELSKAMTKRQG